MIMSQKDQIAVVDMMAALYLRLVAPRTAREVSLEEFRAYMAANMHPEKLPAYREELERQKQLSEIVRLMEKQMANGGELLALIEDFKDWAQRPRDDDEALGG